MSDATLLAPERRGPAPSSFGEELGATARLAGPLVLANLLQMAIWASDVLFIARLGPAPLAASTLSVYAYSVMLWAMMGVTSAVAPVIAAELGRGRAVGRHPVREVRRSVRMALWLAAIGSVPMMVICLFGEQLMLATGQDREVARLAGEYMPLIGLAALPTLASAVLRIFVSALDRPGWATAITAIALPVNLLGNYLLVFGNWGAPRMELAGAAIASVITALFMLGCYLLLLRSNRRFRRFALLGRLWLPDWQRLRELAKLGGPIGAIYVLEGGVFNAAAFLMGLIGVTELAGHAVAMQIAALAFQVPFGIAQAATIRVGLAYGAGNAQWVARAGHASFVFGLGLATLSALIIWLFPRELAGLYLDPSSAADAAAIGFAVQFMAIAALFQLFDASQTIAAGVLRGLQDTRMPMLIAACGYWIGGFGTAVLLGLYTSLEGLGIWIGLATGLALVSVALAIRWTRRASLGLLPQ